MNYFGLPFQGASWLAGFYVNLIQDTAILKEET